MPLKVRIQEGRTSSKNADLNATFVKLHRKPVICTPGVSIINEDNKSVTICEKMKFLSQKNAVGRQSNPHR